MYAIRSYYEKATHDWSNHTVLVAEDEETNFVYLQTALQRTNITILRAKNGREAVEIAKVTPHLDIILMDIKMPEIVITSYSIHYTKLYDVAASISWVVRKANWWIGGSWVSGRTTALSQRKLGLTRMKPRLYTLAQSTWSGSMARQVILPCQSLGGTRLV